MSSTTPGGSATSPGAPTTDSRSQARETFNTRLVFLMAAIGSAVGLGNIWRFPYVAYDSGGGAFLIPYLIALLTAGVPLLWFFFSIGHRFRASAPLAYRRMDRRAEPIGWLQVGVAFFITIYYAAIIGWAGLYAWKSLSLGWGTDTESYFFNDFLQLDAESTHSGKFVLPILLMIIAVWVITTIVLAADVNKGIGKLTTIFVPLLIVLFLLMVVRALFLDGALGGLNAFFTPDWGALSDSSVWIAAYGQIFFSLSIGFGIMTTYASYLKPRTNLTNTGMVTAFANSSFELLAGIGVFAALGFMAHQTQTNVSEVVSGGIGLAFVAFPTIINEMPFGEVFGILFFVSLFIAGLTSLISLMEVVVSAVKDKFNLERKTTAVIIGAVMGTISTLLFSATTGLIALDIMDKWTNNIGIIFCASLSLILTAWVFKRRVEMTQHLNAVSSVKVGPIWQFFAFVLTPIVLLYTMISEIIGLLKEPYEGYGTAQITTYGWLVLAVIVIAAIVMTIVPFRQGVHVNGIPGSDYGVPKFGRKKNEPNTLAAAAKGSAATTAASNPAKKGDN